MRLDQEQDHRQLSEVKQDLRKEMKHQCLGLASLERTIARQRSRVRELREGDVNTRYFHMKARGRRRKNHIFSIRSGESTVYSQPEIAQVFHDHFSAVLGTDEDRHSTINLSALDMPSLDLADLTEPFTEQEVRAVISEIPSDRAPGPDGFTGAFYKAAWPIIKGDIMWAINSFSCSPRTTFGQNPIAGGSKGLQAHHLGPQLCEVGVQAAGEQAGAAPAGACGEKPECLHQAAFHT